MIKYIFPLVILLLLGSCQSKTITNSEDYNKFLAQTKSTTELTDELNFWDDKLKASPEQHPYLLKRASAHNSIFDQTGKIEHLINAEKDLVEASEHTQHNNAGYLRALASNYISQHRFKEALELLKKAEINGENLKGTKKMLFDAHMELGNYLLAKTYLDEIKSSRDFDYLIRLAKWEDHNGNLEQAIVYMEQAMEITESSNIKANKIWAYTNLADFYGHDGQIEKSYNYYLKALELDPKNAYAKKGIAWIVYSYERNPNEALKLMSHIKSYYSAPDYDLLIADIAEFKGDLDLKSKALEDYRLKVDNPLYGDMYNKYNVLMYTDAELNLDEALAISKKEVNNRPTPESYDLLAWSLFKSGETKKALEVAEQNIIGKTSEPDALYHLAEILKQNGKRDEVSPLKEELLEAIYELGPTMESKINTL
ncbi:cell surface protein [Winogradskyella maritima]|uniref:Tetratricopeptide repeat protein n=1 Tax=Winogradskyella maritima TaxID=1517766 RepID=A0ABV8AGW7_9FLAO|nr:cell surface protein [Winogradskyella maritima]